jgi:integrase
MRRRGELFLDYFRKVADQKSPSTRKLMLSTITRIEALMPNAGSLTFASINRSWLTDFLNALKKTSSSPNYWSIQLRNIRTVWNDARANNIVNNYPFQDFKIPSSPTAKRNLTLDQVRTLMASKGVGERGGMAIDYFMLSLYLIGINDIDLCHLTPDNIVNGRLEYNRAKTGKHYSIKIEPEAMVLIDKYRGKKYLLNALDIYVSHKAFAKYMNMQLKKIGEIEEETFQSKRGVRTRLVAKSDLPKGLSHYWCRHTWASLAHEVGISQDTIALGLGHSFGNQVTAIYINPSLGKVDEANRKVIDFVLGK